MIDHLICSTFLSVWFDLLIKCRAASVTHVLPAFCPSAKVMSLSKCDCSVSIKIMWTGQAGSVRKLPGISPRHSQGK